MVPASVFAHSKVEVSTGIALVDEDYANFVITLRDEEVLRGSGRSRPLFSVVSGW